MTIRHMEILKTIAETRKLYQSCPVLYITQSAISHAVRELEEESGTVLFLTDFLKCIDGGRKSPPPGNPCLVLAACNALEKG